MNDKQNYKKTLNLPQTDFPIRANLKQHEEACLAQWEQERLYEKIQQKPSISGSHPLKKYILHDGPPYANGHIHIGHALNKILKDIIVKSKTMMGYTAPYVPGWDCHGLPIEYEVLKEARSKKETLSPEEVRRRCRDYANRFVEIQRTEFKRLGVLGDWENPYLTMTPDYEAAIVREFGKVVESGGVYKAKKPVLWCPYDETALAEAEVEYADITSPAIYVKFRVTDDPLAKFGQKMPPNLSFIIWTTTPWTLIANKAVCLHPKFDYDLIQVKQEGKHEQRWIIASTLVAGCMKVFGIEQYSVVATHKGVDLKEVVCQSPFREWPSPVILGDHVTLEQGTGAVHTAPGHGREDYQVGMEYDLEVYAPVDSRGRFTDSDWKGIDVFKANAAIQTKLSEIGALVHGGTINHTYPHCWRCKKPVIFRATEQWFISMTERQLRDRAVAAIESKVTWIPEWGKDRILGMMRNRPDWCISRQRSWGVPIVAFSCTFCGKQLYNKTIITYVADQMERESGADIWFSKSARELLPPGTACPNCRKDQFTKESDILDIWFESGVSHAVVLKKRPDLDWPADLYLEGSDQHRGWFHSSLLASLSTGEDRAPYNTVLTHGFVLDGAGKKMSKSGGNVIAPQEIIDRHGAEILRLWVAASDFRDDIRISNPILDQLVEAHRKIRNTCRFLLSNLYDYYSDAPQGSPLEIDRWALHRLEEVRDKILRAYREFEFHTVFHTLNQFCSVDLSTFYLDIIKDRLYASSAHSMERRAAQTVLYKTLSVITQLMAPILSFTAEEIWSALRAIQLTPIGETSVHLANRVSFDFLAPEWTEGDSAAWEQLVQVRDEVNRHLEKERAEKRMSSSLGASVRLNVASPLYELLKQRESFLPTLLIVSQVDLIHNESGEATKVEVTILPARGTKCERCWMVLEDVGNDTDHPTLCARCVRVVEMWGLPT